MEFLEEETRPRFLFQSRTSVSINPSEPQTVVKTTKFTAVVCFSSSSLLLFSAFHFFSSFPIVNFLLVWISVSLLIGPFAPVSLTGGDVSVGNGEILEEPSDPDPTPGEPEEPKRTRRSRRSDAPPLIATRFSAVTAVTKKVEEKRSNADGFGGEVEMEWNEADLQILKKQTAKHPVGTPRRWEIIAEAFGGRHGVESVIRMAKYLTEKKPETSDSFKQFLRQRKPLDKRVEGVRLDNPDVIPSENGALNGNVGNGSSAWNSGEDLALLNALKAFPKDTPMRWEKIEAAVPGKSKASCMKRVTELKRDFRNSKASVA